MTKIEAAITMAAREMSRDAKVELCEMLMRDLDGIDQKEVDDAWSTEIRSRLTAMDRGEGTSKPSDEVVARLRQKRSA